MRALAWFLLLTWPCASVPAPEQKAILNWFNVEDGQWIVPPDELCEPRACRIRYGTRLGAQPGQGVHGADGPGPRRRAGIFRPEHFHLRQRRMSVRRLRGARQAFPGGDVRRQVWVLLERSNGMPVLQSLSYLGAGQAVVTRYVFDGACIKNVSTRDVAGEQIDELLNAIHRAPRVQLNQAAQPPFAGDAPEAARP